MKAIVKLNGGNPVILCSRCRKIIKYLSSEDDLSKPYYCKDCDLSNKQE